MGYYESQPVPPFSKHLGAVSKATPLTGHITSLQHLDVFQKWKKADFLMQRLKRFE